MQTIDFLDFSQFNCFQGCPQKWIERYLKGYKKVYPVEHQRDDAMCIGSLVHEGLEMYYKCNLPQITTEAITEFNPTPEALGLANRLIAGYLKAFPKEAEGWKLIATEAPLRMNATRNSSKPCILLAKLDAYFLVEQTVELPGGPNGEIVVLEPGYWIQEYKTKGDGRRDLFSMRWAVDKQVDFQMLCLQANLPTGAPPVQGVLINAIEKPRCAPPMRTCKKCKTKLEYSSYLIAPSGNFACPVCGHEQELTPLKVNPEGQEPNFFRLPVRRSLEELEESRYHFINTAIQMEDLRYRLTKGFTQGGVIPRFPECVHPIYGACEYFNNHVYHLPVEEDNTFIRTNTIRYAEESN